MKGALEPAITSSNTKKGPKRAEHSIASGIGNAVALSCTLTSRAAGTDRLCFFANAQGVPPPKVCNDQAPRTVTYILTRRGRASRGPAVLRHHAGSNQGPLAYYGLWHSLPYRSPNQKGSKTAFFKVGSRPYTASCVCPARYALRGGR